MARVARSGPKAATGESQIEFSARLKKADGEALKQFGSFARISQFRSVVARNLHLANWFEAIAKAARSEMNHREGKEASDGDPDRLLRTRTAVLTDIEIEAVAMGFGTVLAKRGEGLDEGFRQLLEAAYEPLRAEYLRRQTVDHPDAHAEK